MEATLSPETTADAEREGTRRDGDRGWCLYPLSGCRSLLHAIQLPLPRVEDMVPDETFGQGEDAARTLCFARGVLGTIYVIILLGVLSVVIAFLRGRVEIMDHRLKFDHLEAPSVAVCPWTPNDTIHRVTQQVAWPRTIRASHFGLEGTNPIEASAQPCVFDRFCACLDLSRYVLADIHTDHVGLTGEVSSSPVSFRERIDLDIDLDDRSERNMLKIGLYDSFDSRPSWFYIPEGCHALGALRLDAWSTGDVGTVWQDIRTGKLGSPLKARHFYTYTRSIAPPTESTISTKLSYEFQTFFVVETMSSGSFFSLFSLASLAVLVVALANLLSIYNVFFPYYEIAADPRREVAPILRVLSARLGRPLGANHGTFFGSSSNANTKAATTVV